MLKSYFDEETGARMIVGEAGEIIPVYKSIRRRVREHSEATIYPSHFDASKFHMSRVYGLEIIPNEGGMTSTMWIRSASTVCRILGIGGNCE